jgi:homoserine kinase
VTDASEQAWLEKGAEIVVPGSISNLGPGFDAVSVAVQLYIRVRILEIRPAAPDTLETEFGDRAPCGDNRIEVAFRHARASSTRQAPGLRIQVSSDIPFRAGLGSSGAATVAGLRLYEAVTSPQSSQHWLRMATEIEGHPDNAAASLLGGLAVSCVHDDGRVTARTAPWPEALRFVVATPDVGLDTRVARGVLPQTVALRDAVFNLQRALLLLRAVEDGQYEDLREAMRDRWHQPCRAPLVPGLDEALLLHDPAILGVCLSGAGPSIVALVTDGAAAAAERLGDIYRRIGVPVTIRTLAAHPSSREATPRGRDGGGQHTRHPAPAGRYRPARPDREKTGRIE